MHTRCVYWGDFLDLPTYLTAKCMCFQAVKGITIALLHCVPLQFHPCLFLGFLRASLSPTSNQMVIGCLPSSSRRVWAVHEHQVLKGPRNELFPIVCPNTLRVACTVRAQFAQIQPYLDLPPVYTQMNEYQLCCSLNHECACVLFGESVHLWWGAAEQSSKTADLGPPQVFA